MPVFVEKVLLVLLDLLTRVLYAVYWVLPYAFVACLAAALWAATSLPALLHATPWRLGSELGLALVLALVGSRRRAARDNPHRQYPGLTGALDRRIDSLFAWIGTLKYFRSPMCMVEDPGSYLIKGDQVRQLIDGVLQPGDILLRGYDGYIDGLLIRKSGAARGPEQYFSHAAIYLGDLDAEHDQPIAARRLQTQDDAGRWVEASEDQKQAIRQSASYYQNGRQKVIHSMTRGVFTEDILTFLRCDHLAVLRLSDAHIRYDPATIDAAGRTMLIHDLAGEGLAIHNRLMQDEAVSRTEVLHAVRHSALGKIGSCYDFQFNAVKTAHVFSCSEFVYYCFKSIHCYLGLLPQKHAFLNVFFARDTITPADIYNASQAAPGQPPRLQVIWSSQS